MTAMHFRDLMTFDAALHIGQHVRISWTCCYRSCDATATVTKLNRKSVLAAIDEPIYASPHLVYGSPRLGTPALIYPAGHIIKVPRFTASKEWTAYNCVVPLEEE
jgi:hypothetical protein